MGNILISGGMMVIHVMFSLQKLIKAANLGPVCFPLCMLYFSTCKKKHQGIYGCMYLYILCKYKNT